MLQAQVHAGWLLCNTQIPQNDCLHLSSCCQLNCNHVFQRELLTLLWLCHRAFIQRGIKLGVTSLPASPLFSDREVASRRPGTRWKSSSHPQQADGRGGKSRWTTERGKNRLWAETAWISSPISHPKGPVLFSLSSPPALLKSRLEKNKPARQSFQQHQRCHNSCWPSHTTIPKYHLFFFTLWLQQPYETILVFTERKHQLSKNITYCKMNWPTQHHVLSVSWDQFWPCKDD